MLVKLHTSKINDTNKSTIDSIGAYEVLVVNQSANLIFVDGVPIPALTERIFKAPEGKKWSSNFKLELGNNVSSSVDIYVTKTIDA